MFSGDLAAVLKERKGKPVEEEVVWDWFTQVCLALKHMHDRHVMHRDVKCQNIFLTKVQTGCVVASHVCDFSNNLCVSGTSAEWRVEDG